MPKTIVFSSDTFLKLIAVGRDRTSGRRRRLNSRSSTKWAEDRKPRELVTLATDPRGGGLAGAQVRSNGEQAP